METAATATSSNDVALNLSNPVHITAATRATRGFPRQVAAVRRNGAYAGLAASAGRATWQNAGGSHEVETHSHPLREDATCNMNWLDLC